MIRAVLKKGLGMLGFEIHRKRASVPTIFRNSFTMQAALNRCIDRGLDVQTVIDVGASDGRWSRNLMACLPNANYLLVEAQEGHRKALENFRKENSNVEIVLAAAGSKKGKIYFDNSDLFGGVASEQPLKDGIVVPVVSLDEQVFDLQLLGPYLLKLDTHGFEIPILEGSKKILEKASLIIIETYNFKITDESLRYWEMCNYMGDLGFSPVENVDLLLRETDKAFWQMDIFFIPSQDLVFSKNSYS